MRAELRCKLARESPSFFPFPLSIPFRPKGISPVITCQQPYPYIHAPLQRPGRRRARLLFILLHPPSQRSTIPSIVLISLLHLHHRFLYRHSIASSCIHSLNLDRSRVIPNPTTDHFPGPQVSHLPDNASSSLSSLVRFAVVLSRIEYIQQVKGDQTAAPV